MKTVLRLAGQRQDSRADSVTDEDGELNDHASCRYNCWSCLAVEILPEGMSFDLVNQAMTKKAISNVINACYRQLGLKKTVVFADQLMYTGFRMRRWPVFRSALTTWLSRRARSDSGGR